MLVEEVHKRTGIDWEIATDWPGDDRAVIALGLASAAKRFAAPYSKAITKSAERLGQEGYSINTFDDRNAPTVIIAGHDPRGVLFGVGRLLREMRMTPGKIELADRLQVATTPRYSASRPSIGLPPEDEFLRCLGLTAVGAVLPRSHRVWHECRRACSAAHG